MALYMYIGTFFTISTSACLFFTGAETLTLSPPNQFTSAKISSLLQCASLSLKIGENVVLVSNSLDPGATPSYSASHPDPICFHMGPKMSLAG